VVAVGCCSGLLSFFGFSHHVNVRCDVLEYTARSCRMIESCLSLTSPLVGP